MRKAPLVGVARPPESRTLGLGRTLQRLFSTFPDSWPGLGLLLLRLGLGLRVIYFGVLTLAGKSADPTVVLQVLIAAVAGVFLLAGLWTPIVGTLLVLDEVWIALAFYLSHNADIAFPIFLAVLSASLAMLGPGAWSIDARLFGRRRLSHDRIRSQRSYF